MNIFAIDPGTEKSAWVTLAGGEIVDFDIVPNQTLLGVVRVPGAEQETMVIEMVASYGQPVGKTVFETCVWIGRFIQAWVPRPYVRLYRKKDVCMHLCQSTRAKDSWIRQAIIDRYPPTGGGKTPQIGTKKQPGPLYGVTKDVWSALALAITYQETQERSKK